jgi:diguanylate cyclase (GGDEF)-like protein
MEGSAPEGGRSATHILVVDDSRPVRMRVTGILRGAGYQVSEANDGIAAAQTVLAHPIDLVVTDQNMPAMSGLQLCRLLQADPNAAGVPIVLLTATTGREVAFWAERFGAAAFVAKDHLDDLLPTVERALAERPAPRRHAPIVVDRETVHGRIAELLDRELRETILAGEVSRVGQALAAGALTSDLGSVADALVAFFVRLLDTRWVWLATPKRSFVYCRVEDARRAHEHMSSAAATAAPRAAFRRAAGLVPSGERLHALPIVFGGREIGAIGFATAYDDRQGRLALVARELAAPLQVCLLLQQATEDARTDALTGLLNRRSAAAELEREVSYAHRHGTPLGVIMVDLDHFKQINDRHGHDGGDAALVGAAAALRGALRGSDFCARWGGEEFVVVARNADAPGTVVVAERIRTALAAAAIFDGAGIPIPVTASCGVAVLRAGDDVATVLTRADEALYAAKRSGRNRVTQAA